MAGYFNKYYLHQRFFPGFISIFINPFFFIRKRLVEKIRLLAPELHGKLLDFGCGAKPYRLLFSNTNEYIGVDIENEGHDHCGEQIDVYYDGKHLPFGDESFDAILTSEVLEHVPELNECIQELYWVLKPGGRILITVPFVWQEHELPFDFRRFSVTGIKKQLTDNGFKILVEERTGHFLEVVIQLWMTYLRRLFYVNNKYVNLALNCIFISPACITGLFFSWIFPPKKDLYFNAVILAEKMHSAVSDNI
ncbi:MAG: methyltransferase domain-containing protein [Tannerella sp.]|jgi:SAM-dependent methyltransferase|nr:methyltransferase domain-containing protein [Tannerella sp.]